MDINQQIDRCIVFLNLSRQPDTRDLNDHEVKCLDMKLEAVSDMINELRDQVNDAPSMVVKS